MDAPKQYWFPAKRHGWGWGPPVTWQGWAVLAVFAVLLGAGALVFLPRQDNVSFVLYALLLAIAVGAVCYAKGEPPSWRPGGK